MIVVYEAIISRPFHNNDICNFSGLFFCSIPKAAVSR